MAYGSCSGAGDYALQTINIPKNANSANWTSIRSVCVIQTAELYLGCSYHWLGSTKHVSWSTSCFVLRTTRNKARREHTARIESEVLLSVEIFGTHDVSCPCTRSDALTK
ncbi:U1 [Hyposoter didymator ichnovirus]|nr:U1 [Hyposoter didymator ichnovirus]